MNKKPTKIDRVRDYLDQINSINNDNSVTKEKQIHSINRLVDKYGGDFLFTDKECNRCHGRGKISKDVGLFTERVTIEKICKECKSHIEADKRGKKIDKLLKRSIWRKIRDFVGV